MIPLKSLTDQELTHLETFVTTSLSDPSALSHQELLDAITENQELCARAVSQLRCLNSQAPEVTEADLVFLESWLKARNLMIGGMQLLQMADPENAASIQHEVECTETAFTILPALIAQARGSIKK